MSQYKIGTVSVTNGSAIITGSGTAWQANAAPGDLFVRAGDEAVYTVGSVATDGQMTLTTPYGGVTGSGVGYVLHRDFHPNGQPLLRNGDVETAAIFNAFAAAVAPVSGFGSAAYATLATTGTPTSGVPNAALGFYGLGTQAVPPSASISIDDNTLKNGLYRAEAPTTTGDIPIGTAGIWLQMMRENGARGSQLFFQQNGSGVYQRFWNGSSWPVWFGMYHTGNAVGTVQADGSGAIIETGTNANGTYTKFADGTMICGLPETATGFANASNLAKVWTYPASFVGNPPKVVPSLVLDAYSSRFLNIKPLVYSRTIGLSAASIGFASNGSFVAGDEALGDNVSAIAIGRWKA